MSLNEDILLGIDLNLLLTFLVVFRERSVSEAARHLRVTQPAVSGSLVRLRQCFDDPLFLRRNRKMQPTPKAEEIAEALLPAMLQIESVIRHP
ncbi:LysR family transcriptional regulator [Pseudomonas sp. Bc-h]|jgi:DNA-binding transcriptional LysR family regulator|uniref:helix-turn-helix domain-containing protein n=1 Tax=unclassified Pseudomonas TaxID=196821 RepID=UPI0009DA84A4|nr:MULTISPECIES: LysR family transcriptional regulator [unclassified Pseudomonas]MDE1198634.1 LysR family transcriptional regulator [Pseudomonas sp.]OQR36964.1 LysR family transcriptional regulator [Pseudomonas sp. Bc-h]